MQGEGEGLPEVFREMLGDMLRVCVGLESSTVREQMRPVYGRPRGAIPVSKVLRDKVVDGGGVREDPLLLLYAVEGVEFREDGRDDTF